MRVALIYLVEKQFLGDTKKLALTFAEYARRWQHGTASAGLFPPILARAVHSAVLEGTLLLRRDQPVEWILQGKKLSQRRRRKKRSSCNSHEIRRRRFEPQIRKPN
jgi:hypothetical protein